MNHEEQQIVLTSHHPAIGEVDRTALEKLRSLLRDLSDKERTLAHRQRRVAKGSADPGGRRTPGAGASTFRRKEVFVAALKRVNKELRRLQNFEARRELGEAARRALALRRARQFARPANHPTPHDGMRALPSRRRAVKLPPSKVGRVSQANKRAQARRDSRR
ncbi:hypothetical protein A5906_02225 [Bradyrhizobium sacchari]|uniref:hypothetical protein n=1 Tax=Bradyrhizobium sacchari TaxID=1399419 RepID=UPI0009B0C55E|nr:hypothetical protein [Bradyrhizobium sacchari]OPY96121.1 hypothetical protein A5906_02225 [Bradyrhizobium sacchari]